MADTSTTTTKDYDLSTHGFTKIYAMGDIHGDFNLLLILLRFCAQVIDAQGKWIGKEKTCVVLVGDTIDRKRPEVPSVGELEGEELLIHLFLNQLHQQAKDHGSKVIKCLGNHEEMNIDGIYDYATAAGKRLRKAFPIRRGSLFSKLIYTENTYPCLKIGEHFFVHGGVQPVTDTNVQLLKNAKEVMQKYFTTTETLRGDDEKTRQLASQLLWDRTYTLSQKCNDEEVKKKLRYLGAKKMISGHTVTVYDPSVNGTYFTCKESAKSGDITTCTDTTENSQRFPGIHMSCNEHVFRVDNGASRAFGLDKLAGRKPQLLLIDLTTPPETPSYSVIRYNHFNISTTPISDKFTKEDKRAIKDRMMTYFNKFVEKNSALQLKGGFKPNNNKQLTPLQRYLLHHF